MFQRFAIGLFLSLVFSGCSNDDPDPNVEVDENLYINELYPSSGDDWIELYNASDKQKDISGYKIYDDETQKYTLPAGTVIASKSFVVLICDNTATGLHTNFKLSASGETVFLENSSGKIIDKVEFPALNNGESYGRYPDGSATLAISGNATQGSSNGDTQAALISSVTRNFTVPQLDQDVTIKAEVVANAGVKAVKLNYRLDGGSFTTVTMAKNAGFYEAVIPAYNTTGKVQYYVSVETNAGKTTVSPTEAPDKTYHYLLNTDELPQLRVNEFMAINVSCCPDHENGTDEFDDWIEIFNAGDVPVDVGGMYLSDDATDPFKNHIPDDDPTATTIPPGGYLVFWADEQGGQGSLHANFKLAADGESVGIYYRDGRTIDVCSFVAQQENVSTGRSVDGAGTWISFSNPTQGASNQ